MSILEPLIWLMYEEVKFIKMLDKIPLMIVMPYRVMCTSSIYTVNLSTKLPLPFRKRQQKVLGTFLKSAKIPPAPVKKQRIKNEILEQPPNRTLNSRHIHRRQCVPYIPHTTTYIDSEGVDPFAK